MLSKLECRGSPTAEQGGGSRQLGVVHLLGSFALLLCGALFGALALLFEKLAKDWQLPVRTFVRDARARAVSLAARLVELCVHGA